MRGGISALTAKLTFIKEIEGRIRKDDSDTSDYGWKDNSEYGGLAHGIHEYMLGF